MTIVDWIPWIILTVMVFGPCIAVLCFIVVASTKSIRDSGQLRQLPVWVRGLVWCCLPIGVLFDWLYNYTVAVYATGEPPRRGELLLTARLRRYRRLSDEDERKRWAVRKWSWLNLFDKGHW